MSKTKRRKKSRSRASAGSGAVQEKVEHQVPASFSRRAPMARKPSLQNAVFSLMVTLGCLGLAAFFTFFYAEDPNHYLYGGMAGLTALGWLVISVRRWSLYRQSVN